MGRQVWASHWYLKSMVKAIHWHGGHCLTIIQGLSFKDNFAFIKSSWTYHFCCCCRDGVGELDESLESVWNKHDIQHQCHCRPSWQIQHYTSVDNHHYKNNTHSHTTKGFLGNQIHCISSSKSEQRKDGMGRENFPGNQMHLFYKLQNHCLNFRGQYVFISA